MNDHKKRIAQLTPDKLAALSALLRRRPTDLPAAEPECRLQTATDQVYPLSSTQQRLWLLEQMYPGNTAYHVNGAVKLKGHLNVAALEQSLQQLIERHEALRTVISSQDGMPVQRIVPAQPFSLSVVDLARQSQGTGDAEALQLAKQEAARPFDLTTGPLIRASLIRTHSTEHLLLICMHHIVADAWSVSLLFRELSALYEALAAGRHISLPPLPVQYVDFVQRQRSRLQGDTYDRLLQYWLSQLGGTLPILQLPADRPRPPVQSFRGARVQVAIPDTLVRTLSQVAQGQGATLFMALLTVFKILLYRYTFQEDLLVGTPIANRTHVDAEGLVGFFVNTLVLRTSVQGKLSFRELLRHVRETALDAYSHQDMPFETLVSELQPNRDLSHMPLCQVFFALQSVPALPQTMGSLVMVPVEIPSAATQFDLSLVLEECDGGLIGRLEYSTDLFEPETTMRISSHFQRLLEGVVKDPDCCLADLPMLTEAEHQQLMEEFNGPVSDYVGQNCIHTLFEQQVERTPGSVAAICESKVLTYAELNRRANQLAHYLRELGVGPESLVAVFMERSLDMLVVIMGILKAGGAYLPIPPTHPSERVTFMLGDACPVAVVTQESVATRLPAFSGSIVRIDSNREIIAHRSPENPSSGVTPDNLCYVIFTSGSTGRPKGVMVCHRNVVSLFHGLNERIPITSADAKLALSNLSFDAAVMELLWPLTCGAKVVILADYMQMSKDTENSLFEQIQEHGVTMVLCTPSLMQTLVRQPGVFPFLRSLRTIILGGEAVPASLVALLSRELPARLINAYGPTEAAVASTTHEITAVDDIIPIGKPLSNTRTYILDPNLHPVPVGVPGELYIGGAGVSRGYLGRPEFTAQRFLHDPFTPEPSARMYRSGDLARYLPSGVIEYLGRTDSQVKIRGFRIELGEIESLIRQFPAVGDGATVLREVGPGDHKLVAYVVPGPEQALSVSDLRAFLKARVPDYMVPTWFVLLDALPLSPNGKVDRAALPAPERSALEEANAWAPQTVTEKVLVGIWMRLLGLEHMSIRDNFFEVGGDSLRAVQLIVEARKAGLPISLKHVFEFQTCREMAEFLDGTHEEPALTETERKVGAVLVKMQPKGTQLPLFLVHAYSGYVFPYIELTRRLGRDQPVYGLQSLGLSGEWPPQTDLESMAALYIEAVRSVQPNGPYRLGGMSYGGLVTFVMAQQLLAAGQQVELVALLDTVPPTHSVHVTDLSVTPTALVKMFGRFLDAEELDRRAADPDLMLQYVLEQGRATKWGSRPFLASLEHLRRYLTSCLAFTHAVAKHKFEVYPGQLVFFHADESPRENAHLWQQFSSRPLEVIEVPGSHMNLVEPPFVDVLADLLNKRILSSPLGKGGME